MKSPESNQIAAKNVHPSGASSVPEKRPERYDE
jgi:hypothetical protein